MMYQVLIIWNGVAEESPSSERIGLAHEGYLSQPLDLSLAGGAPKRRKVRIDASARLDARLTQQSTTGAALIDGARPVLGPERHRRVATGDLGEGDLLGTLFIPTAQDRHQRTSDMG